MPQLILWTGTRVAMGMGIGLLLAGRLNRHQRRAAGRALAIVGGLATVPLAIGIFRESCSGGRKSQSAA